MRTVILSVVTLGMLGVWGCSNEGGKIGGGEGFRIVTPVLGVTLKQGDTVTANIQVDRGRYFKEDVKVKLEPSKGITVDPADVTVKASDPETFHVRIAAPKDAALGEYRVHITATPGTGTPTMYDMKVRVVKP